MLINQSFIGMEKHDQNLKSIFSNFLILKAICEEFLDHIFDF